MAERNYELELKTMLANVNDKIELLINSLNLNGDLNEREEGQWETLWSIKNFIEEWLDERDQVDKD